MTSNEISACTDHAICHALWKLKDTHFIVGVSETSEAIDPRWNFNAVSSPASRVEILFTIFNTSSKPYIGGIAFGSISVISDSFSKFGYFFRCDSKI